MRTFFLLFAFLMPSMAHAGPPGNEPSPVLSRVRARGVVLCGGVERPGLAQPLQDGRVGGLEADVCRAVAAAALGNPDHFEFHLYAAPADFARARKGLDDVTFLTGSEMVENELAGLLGPAAAVYVESHAVMVPAASPNEHLLDLAGAGICFLIGGSPARSLEAYFDDHQLAFLRHPYSEVGEMNDAYAVQRCQALAGEATTLAMTRLNAGVNDLKSRLLPEPLSAFPIHATTGTKDGRWTAIVAWTVATLLSGERPESRWYSGGAAAMPVAAAELGLDKGWQRRVLESVGSYREVFERNLGKRSPLKLERGLNASPAQGGALLSPIVD